MTPPSITSLTLINGNGPARNARCIALVLAHNEATRLPDFLAHHRALGVDHFLFVDDFSTDDTRILLGKAEDVTLFEPKGTTYKQHKALWRSELGDHYAASHWLLLLDVDELLVYPACETRPLPALLAHLEATGAEALFTPMIDMYADEALTSSHYEPGTSMIARFPFFDSDGFRLAPPSIKHLRRFPTPVLDLYGGTRERLFYDQARPNALQRWVLRRFQSLDRDLEPGWAGTLIAHMAKRLVKGLFPRPVLVMSKIALVRWQVGMQVPGGPHSITPKVTLARLWGALLHFKYINVAQETAYKVARGQHAKGSVHYQAMLDHSAKFDTPALYPGSRRYQSSADLLACGLLRNDPVWQAENPT